jgi:hypothetical protein
VPGQVEFGLCWIEPGSEDGTGDGAEEYNPEGGTLSISRSTSIFCSAGCEPSLFELSVGLSKLKVLPGFAADCTEDEAATEDEDELALE